MTLHGTVRNGQIVLDPPGQLPEGMRVEVVAVDLTERPDSIFRVFGRAERLRCGEDIDAQIREERSWGDE